MHNSHYLSTLFHLFNVFFTYLDFMLSAVESTCEETMKLPVLYWKRGGGCLCCLERGGGRGGSGDAWFVEINCVFFFWYYKQWIWYGSFLAAWCTEQLCHAISSIAAYVWFVTRTCKFTLKLTGHIKDSRSAITETAGLRVSVIFQFCLY